MKKIILSILLGIIAHTVSSQELLAVLDNPVYEMKSKTMSVKPSVHNLQHVNTPSHVKHFENLALQWGKKKIAKTDRPTKPFNVTFKSEKGQITATYNQNGNVIAIEEVFNNVALPKHVIFSIYKKYEGWTVMGNLYSVSYKKDDYFKMLYEVELQKGNETKTIKIGTDSID